MQWYVKKADYDRTRTMTDFDRRAYQAYIQPSAEGFSVFNTHDDSYLMSFERPEDAKAFADEYDAANMRRRGVGKVYEKYLPVSLDSTSTIADESKVLRLDPNAKFDQEQSERDRLLAPQNWHERRERFLKLRSHGLPHVPELKNELDRFRTNPARPHGLELPPVMVPDVPSVEELKRRSTPLSLVAFVNSICRFAQAAPAAQPVMEQPQADTEQPPAPPRPATEKTPQPSQQPAPVPGAGSHTDDMQYLISPDGVEYHVPGYSHSGEAQKIVTQTEGRTMDPAEALDYLLKKKKWVRVSGETFQMLKFKFRRPVIQQFISRHQDYYKAVRVLEIDDMSSNDIYQMPMSAFLQGVDPQSESLQRAQDMRRWRD